MNFYTGVSDEAVHRVAPMDAFDCRTRKPRQERRDELLDAIPSI